MAFTGQLGDNVISTPDFIISSDSVVQFEVIPGLSQSINKDLIFYLIDELK